MNMVILDAIQGHAPRTEGEKYGVFPPKVMLAEIEEYPRYEIARSNARMHRRRDRTLDAAAAQTAR